MTDVKGEVQVGTTGMFKKKFKNYKLKCRLKRQYLVKMSVTTGITIKPSTDEGTTSLIM